MCLRDFARNDLDKFGRQKPRAPKRKTLRSPQRKSCARGTRTPTVLPTMPFSAAQPALAAARFNGVAFVKGNTIYVAGGSSSPSSIERTTINDQGNLGPFNLLVATLQDQRAAPRPSCSARGS